MRIDIKDLFGSVPAMRSLDARIGWPDDPTSVDILDVDEFADALDATMRAFYQLRPGTETLVDVKINTVRASLITRILQNGEKRHHGNTEESLAPSLGFLSTVIAQNAGQLAYWGGNNYMDILFPYDCTGREDRPEVKDLPWEQYYQCILERESWSSLRNRAFRFCDLAASATSRCVDFNLTNVLIPSVGICVHAWLFANCGISVTATDSARNALSALSDPASWPKVFSRAAHERWDISACATYARIPHYHSFNPMPALEEESVRSALQRQISFLHADWANIPLESRSVDLVFATNAVPRGSAQERRKVLEEWVRVLRPGGVIFIAQHHPPCDWGLNALLGDKGLRELDFLGGQRPDAVNGGFQTRYSSG